MTGLWLGWPCHHAGLVLCGHNAIARLSALGEMPRCQGAKVHELAVKCLFPIQRGFHLLVKLH